jgi:peptidoglycan/LPS O-acetylase OafA/YrhL
MASGSDASNAEDLSAKWRGTPGARQDDMVIDKIEAAPAPVVEPIDQANAESTEVGTTSMNPILAVPSIAIAAAPIVMTAREALRSPASVMSATETAVPPKKKPRIDALDSLRFFLIAYIASGHFIHTATKSMLVLRLISQINVVVGAFFVLSGYVAAYTTTNLGERTYIAKRLDDPVQFTVSRVMGFWPLHMLVLAIFSPMFFAVDAMYNGPIRAGFHGLISGGLLSAWFPLSAEVWNAPTWFLSALSFCFLGLPYSLKVLAKQTKSQLRRTLGILTCLSLVPKIAYSYDLKAWGIFEGMMSAATHPNYALFNTLRFSPLGALLEVLMGAAACRLVMLDTDKETEDTRSSVWPLAGMIAVIAARATGLLTLNDLLTRAALFIPMFIAFLTRMHRESVGSKGPSGHPVGRFLNFGLFKWLGGISFPIFIVHGPLGQLFFKKAVAQKLWGGSLARIPGFFGVYWAAVIGISYLLNKFFVQNKKVGEVSRDLSAKICKPLSD